MKTLAVINSVQDIQEILKKALFFAQNGDIEILFVHEEKLFELPDLFKPKFMKDEQIDTKKIKDEIKKALKELKYQKECAIFVYINDTISHIETLLKENEALIVAKYNRYTQKLTESSYNLLYLKDASKNEYKNIAIVTNLTPKDSQLIDFAKLKFKDSNLILLYDYIYMIDMNLIAVDPLIDIDADPYLDQELKETSKNRFDALAEGENLRGVFLEGVDKENIADFINENSYDLTIIEKIDTQLLEDLKSDVLIM